MSRPEQERIEEDRQLSLDIRVINAPDKSGEWTGDELKILRLNAHLGAGVVAAKLGRSERAVRQQAHRLRISLRRDGERRGLRIGQPRGISWVESPDHRIRDLVDLEKAGRIDLAAIERRVVADAIERTKPIEDRTPLCPACSKRPVRKTIGLCDVCYREGMADAHDEEFAKLNAQRRLWTSRQRLKRLRRELGVKAPKARDAS